MYSESNSQFNPYINGDKFNAYCMPNLNGLTEDYKGYIIYNNQGNIISVAGVIVDVQADNIFFFANPVDYTIEEMVEFIQNLGVIKNEIGSER